MKNIILIVTVAFGLSSCFKDIDTVPLERLTESTFTVQNSIKTTQSYFYFYENIVQQVGTSSPRSWDLAFESAGPGSRVMLGWASGSLGHKSGKFNISEVSQDEILDLIDNSNQWTFNDPAYTNYTDSLTLKDWEDGEVYIQNRGVESDNYYLIQFVEKTENSYTFNYAKATDNQNIQSYTIERSAGLAYVYFSFDENAEVSVEPRLTDWDIVFTPYLGWWETLVPGEYSPYIQSGVLINYEAGVEVAQIFDENIDFTAIDETCADTVKFTSWKGVIGSNWKILGAIDSENIYEMDPNKKYILKKYDPPEEVFKYFKFRIIDYKLNGEDHFPTVEFKFLGNV
ncbi:MAG: HmuY family protein [Bacteroidota bacterium]|nr:HmuY family protein [Bacteroidota bacterium]